MLPVFRTTFESAKEAALKEMQHRRDQRCQELRRLQSRIADEAFVRLGRWLEACEAQLQRRFSDVSVGSNPVQLRLDTPDVRRRQTLLRKEQEKLQSKERERRRDIEAMREVRGETIDAIGALVLIPEQYELPAR